jgi:hypothetical protein
VKLHENQYSHGLVPNFTGNPVRNVPQVVDGPRDPAKLLLLVRLVSRTMLREELAVRLVVVRRSERRRLWRARSQERLLEEKREGANKLLEQFLYKIL